MPKSLCPNWNPIDLRARGELCEALIRVLNNVVEIERSLGHATARANLGYYQLRIAPGAREDINVEMLLRLTRLLGRIEQEWVATGLKWNAEHGCRKVHNMLDTAHGLVRLLVEDLLADRIDPARRFARDLAVASAAGAPF
ncbi:hypothetical protein [Methylobacterium frigidaeris]|uniref:Uncharacterized protein n=1 Tax=Methylobacterium frigidaeris TaxID=2038277 RepID=A0AA37HHY8_9HYPH|nr:hypothetical protein [Methylobacterium frigidaeris]GJD66462.1 hypothetical protein MPEAHAMD_6660 [Methylobacterium frigidaeris]